MKHDKDITDKFSALTNLDMPQSEFGEVWDNISREMRKSTPRMARRRKMSGFAASVGAAAAVAIVAAGVVYDVHSRGASPSSPDHSVTATNNTSPTNSTTDTNTNQPENASSPTPQPKHKSLMTVAMVNQTTGWAAGVGTLWRTIDGGTTWQNLSPKGFAASANDQVLVYGLDENQAWVAVGTPTGQSVAVYRTNDGGQSWVRKQIPDTGSPMSLHFRDGTHGWIALLQGAAMGSEAETVYQTSDGGLTWKKASYTNDKPNGTLPLGGDKTGVTFLDANQGWATGFNPADGQIYLYQTVDNGKTWKTQKLAVPADLKNAEFTSHPPVFFSQQEGLLPVSFGSGLLTYRTADGGKTWQPGNVVNSTAQFQAIQTWSFPTMDNGFATDGILLFATSDGGQTWKSITPNISFKNITTIDFQSANDGWALMNSGVLYRTTDGGRTWDPVNE